MMQLRLLSPEPFSSLKLTKFKFAIFVDDVEVGYRIFQPLSGKLAKTGCEILNEHRNKGYATKSMFLLIDYAWRLGFETLITGVHESNKASQTVLFRTGFRVDFKTQEEGGVHYQCRLDKSWSNWRHAFCPDVTVLDTDLIGY